MSEISTSSNARSKRDKLSCRRQQNCAPNDQTFYVKFPRSHLLGRGSWHPALELYALVASVRLPGQKRLFLRFFVLKKMSPELGWVKKKNFGGLCFFYSPGGFLAKRGVDSDS